MNNYQYPKSLAQKGMIYGTILSMHQDQKDSMTKEVADLLIALSESLDNMVELANARDKDCSKYYKKMSKLRVKVRNLKVTLDELKSKEESK